CSRSGGPFPRRNCRPSCAACGRAYQSGVVWCVINRSLKRNVLRVDVARRLLATAGRRGGRDGGFDRLRGGLTRLLAAWLEELDLGGVDLVGFALLPVLALALSGLQSALGGDEAALVEVLAADFGEISPAEFL